MSDKTNLLKNKSFAFSIRIINLYKYLGKSKKEFVISNQLLRSGTAIGALIREAQNAESDKDFIHKLAISQKECDESLYWLELLKDTNYLSEIEFESINMEGCELLKMLRSAILTSKRKASFS